MVVAAVVLVVVAAVVLVVVPAVVVVVVVPVAAPPTDLRQFLRRKRLQRLARPGQLLRVPDEHPKPPSFCPSPR